MKQCQKIRFRVYVICHYDEFSQPYSVDEFDKTFEYPMEALNYQRTLNESFEEECKDELYAENSFYMVE